MKYFKQIILAYILCKSVLLANIINVPADTDSIQGAIDMAVDGDTVLVQPGTYLENINFNGKNIVVGSLTLTTGDTSYISQTVIDGDSSYRVVTISNGEDSTAVLCGFTLRNGYADEWDGGGINVSGSSPHLSYLIVKNNIATYDFVWHIGGQGGGIFLAGSNAILKNLSVKNNYVYGGDAAAGGGIHITNNSSPVLINVKVIGNTISWPQGGWSGIGNINANPIFVDTANGNYRLQAVSPCIDAGIQDTMIIYNNGQDTLVVPPIAYNGNAPDMGAHEYGDPTKMEVQIEIPKRYTLKQNYPNPFNPSTTIKFQRPN